MTTVLKRSSFLIVLLSIFLMFSCSDAIDFNEYKSIDKQGWKANKKISFKVDVKDTISPKNLFIHLRNNNDYQYSNLYLITELNFPNGNIVVDTLQYEMTDETGRFLGTGFSELKENKLFYKEKKVFPIPGKYVFNVHHAMRKNGDVNPIEFLKGIQDVGFSIEKLE
ncbi:gliding motility lipoprotein GldH [Polaribacter sp. Asnod1-A03]|uniref:gliding motility lipoprotein GldH n=1 Tax=Polaribacter sp. Asnod1-A03 TaxID=3160581 RepID=UPI00386A4268